MALVAIKGKSIPKKPNKNQKNHLPKSRKKKHLRNCGAASPPSCPVPCHPPSDTRAHSARCSAAIGSPGPGTASRSAPRPWEVLPLWEPSRPPWGRGNRPRAVVELGEELRIWGEVVDLGFLEGFGRVYLLEGVVNPRFLWGCVGFHILKKWWISYLDETKGASDQRFHGEFPTKNHLSSHPWFLTRKNPQKKKWWASHGYHPNALNKALVRCWFCRSCVKMISHFEMSNTWSVESLGSKARGPWFATNHLLTLFGGKKHMSQVYTPFVTDFNPCSWQSSPKMMMLVL